MNIRTLARKAGLSKSAVSLALRNHPSIPARTRDKVKRIAAAAGYSLNPKISAVLSAIARRTTFEINAPIAVLSEWPCRSMWNEPNSHLERFYCGCATRAAELGYKLEEFWLGAPRMTKPRMEQILRARGIEGVLVFNYTSAPATLDMDLSSYASAVIGRALVQPRLYAVDYDHYQGMFLALEKVAERGYRRPALLLTQDGHERTMHSWAAAYQFAVSKKPRAEQIPVWIGMEQNVSGLRKWFRRYRPDALLVNDECALEHIRQLGDTIPEGIGVATLFWRNDGQGLAGIDARDEIIGARAIELIAEQIRNNHLALPDTPESVLFDGVWRDGPSLPVR